MRTNLAGGPSIVFHRYHKVNETFIQEKTILNPKLCKTIAGDDANGLCMWAISQEIACGHFIRNSYEQNFRPQISQKYGYNNLMEVKNGLGKRGILQMSVQKPTQFSNFMAVSIMVVINTGLTKIRKSE